MLSKNVIFSELLTSCALLAGNAQTKTFTVTARNLDGKNNVVVSRSFDGIMLPLQQPLTFNRDSSVAFDFSGASLEHIFMFVEGDIPPNAPRSVSVYPVSPTGHLSINPRADILFDLYGQEDIERAAVGAAAAPYDLFVKYVTRRGDPLSLRSDSVAVSAERKIMNFTDSLVNVIDRVREPLRTALRQEMALNTLYFWNQIFFGRTSNLDSYENLSPEMAAWVEADKRLTRWADLDNEANALSLRFADVASSDWSKRLSENELNKIWEAGEEARLKKQFDFYARNYAGKARESLLANLIYKDTKDARFSVGLDSLYAEFSKLYPASAVSPFLESAVSKNVAVNSSSKEDPDMRFIETAENFTLDSIIGKFRGKPVIVDVWATWCGPCRKSFEHAALVHEFAKEKGLELLYISIDEGSDRETAVRKLVRSYGLKGNHLIMTPALKQEIHSKFGSDGYLVIPNVALFDSEGRLVRRRFSESEDVQSLIKAIDSALLSPADPE